MIWVGDIIGAQRHAMPREVFGRCAYDEPIRPEELGFEPRIGQISPANDDIEAFFDDIDKSIVEIQIELDFRIERAKLRNDR